MFKTRREVLVCERWVVGGWAKCCLCGTCAKLARKCWFVRDGWCMDQVLPVTHMCKTSREVLVCERWVVHGPSVACDAHVQNQKGSVGLWEMGGAWTKCCLWDACAQLVGKCWFMRDGWCMDQVLTVTHMCKKISRPWKDVFWASLI